jgi:hypothetical protein
MTQNGVAVRALFVKPSTMKGLAESRGGAPPLECCCERLSASWFGYDVDYDVVVRRLAILGALAFFSPKMNRAGSKKLLSRAFTDNAEEHPEYGRWGTCL